MGVIDWLAASPLSGFLGGIAVTVISGIIVTTYRRRQQAREDVAEWYQNAVGLIARVQQTGYRTTTYQHQVNYPKLHEKLEPLAEEIQEHSGDAPAGVDEEARIELAYLAAFCSGVLTLTEQAEDLTQVEFFRNIQRQARQNYDGKHDMEDVNELIDSFDAYSLANDLPKDVDVNEDVLQQFRSQFSDDSLEAGHPTTIDEALEMPLDRLEDVFENDQAMQELLGDSLADYVRVILIDYTEDIYEKMEVRKNRMS